VITEGVGIVVAVAAVSEVSVAGTVGVTVTMAGDPHEIINIEMTRDKNDRTILDFMQNSSSLPN
jgi:hypothetical protein